MRYHFHIIDGIDLPDYRGTILADESQARIYADTMVTHVARAKRSEKNLKFIKVTNDSGVELFRVPVPSEKFGNPQNRPASEPKH